MLIKYFEAADVKSRVEEIIEKLNMKHIASRQIFCVRSVGSKSERAVARIHGLERIWQKTLNLPPYYVIEVISERYDKLSDEEKDKTLIHELLHIPKGFSGGFRPHKGFISRRKVEKLYRELKKEKTREDC